MITLIDTDKINRKATKSFKESKYARGLDKEDGVWYEMMGKLAIIKGTTRFIVTNNECVHSLYESEDEKVSIGFYRHEKTADGQTFGIFPQFNLDIPVKELLEEYASAEKLYWKEWVHLFGSIKERIRYNYAILCNNVKEIGALDKMPKWGK